MSNKGDPTVATRVPPATLSKIKKFHEKLSKKTPGVKVRMSDTIRVLIERGLSAGAPNEELS